MNKKIHFGVMVPQIKRTWDQSISAAETFERLGFDSIWVNDHFYGPQSPKIPMLEAWTLIAALAARTNNVEIGTLVTPVGMRNPQHLGKIISTIDHISNGRIIAGLGSGWMEREFTDCGMPFGTAGQRTTQLRETIQLLKSMWGKDDEVTQHGDFVQATNLATEPKPSRIPPILIGGTGPKVTLPFAAQEADIWNNPAGAQTRLEENISNLCDSMHSINREIQEIIISQQCLIVIAPSEEESAPMIELAQKIFGNHMGDPVGPLAITGTPERVIEQISKHIDLGCSMFMIEFFGTDTKVPAQLFAEKVLPYFRKD